MGDKVPRKPQFETGDLRSLGIVQAHGGRRRSASEKAWYLTMVPCDLERGRFGTLLGAGTAGSWPLQTTHSNHKYLVADKCILSQGAGNLYLQKK